MNKVIAVVNPNHIFQLKVACWADRCLVLDYSETEMEDGVPQERLRRKNSTVNQIQ